jgi:hypothetical protein
MKPILYLLFFLFFFTALNCAPSKTNETAVDSTASEKNDPEEKHELKTCLDVVTEIMETSPTYQKKITAERVQAIEKNGGTLGMEVEGSPHPEDQPVSPSETYDFKMYESYEDHTVVIERFTFDPSKKQLFLYDVVENQLNPIDFNKELLLKFDELCGREEIPIITAIGGQGTSVDWETIAKNTDPNGPDFFEGDCKQSITPLRASSTLAAQGKNKYDSKNVADYDPRTAWVEGNSDFGIGEYFEIEAPNINTIYNGYQSSPTAWKNNSRVKRFKVSQDNKPVCLLDLTDEMGAQLFELPRSENEDASKTHTFKFEIVDVYKGLKYSDVAISEIEWVLCCMSANTIIISDTNQNNIATTEKGNIISGIDIHSGAIAQSEVLKIAKQKHLTLLKISSHSKQIEVTINHPLYIKGHGFISIERYMHVKNLANYQNIVNTAEVLTRNAETGKLEYEKINSIEVLHGVFETYSILKLSKGDTYSANGFVTRTY